MWGSSSPHSSRGCPRSSTGSSAGSTRASAGAPLTTSGPSAPHSPNAIRRKLRAAWMSFFWSLAHAVFWIGLAVLILFSVGCRPRVEYLPHEAEVRHLAKGEAAPWEGWLLSPSSFAELYEAARLNLLEAEEHEAGEAP